MSKFIYVLFLFFITTNCKLKESTDNSSVKVVNGAADYTSYPAVVQLNLFFNSDDSENSGTCTGSIVSDNTIITAAHCVLQADKYKYNAHVEVECVKNAKSDKLYAHPKFKWSDLSHDIAVIVFERDTFNVKKLPVSESIFTKET